MNQRSDPIRTGIGVTHAAQSDGRPAFALVIGLVEPPAGIEPATPSLPWNHQEPLCEPPFPQVTPDRKGQSYGFSFGEVMRSLPSHALIITEASPHPASLDSPYPNSRRPRPGTGRPGSRLGNATAACRRPNCGRG